MTPDLPDDLRPGDLVTWVDADGDTVACREVVALDEEGRPVFGPEVEAP